MVAFPAQVGISVDKKFVMEDSSPPPSLEDTPGTSLFARLTNIFVTPTEVFDEIKSSKRTPANWIAPLVAGIVAGVVYTIVVFSQPAVIQQMQEAQEKKFEQMVASGKTTQQKADEGTAALEKFMTPGMLKLFGSLGSVLMNTALLFFTALIFWAVGSRAFQADFHYLKAVEAVGVSTMINVVGAIVAMLLAVIYGNMAMTPGPALLIKPFDAANKIHLSLSALNLFSIWYVGVLSIGLARMTGAAFSKAAMWLYGIWAALTFGPIWLFGGN